MIRRAPDARSSVQIGDRVRFRGPRNGPVREGEVVRWRKDRAGPQGWLDVSCDDGVERSVRPGGAEPIA